MKKFFAYLVWAIISLAFLVITKNIATFKFPQFSSILIGVSFAIVILTFFLIKGRLSRKDEPEL